MSHSKPTTVSFSMSLYQILSIVSLIYMLYKLFTNICFTESTFIQNEKQQNVDLNAWAIQMMQIWLPDTYLYNSVVMNREETERYINVVVTTNYWNGEKGAEVKFMFSLYRTSCLLDIRFYPYDQQACKLTMSSWTLSKSDINYEPEYESVNMDNFLPNEEWVVVSFNIKRVEEKFVCCPEPWVLLEAVLVVRRKPLYYIVNLVIPTSVITLVAVTGFFTAASTSSERREKLSLGIDSLLAMSILMMMVSEQMPTSSDFVPLFGIFYLSIIFIIFIGNSQLSPIVSYIFFGRVGLYFLVKPILILQIAHWLRMRPPTMLLELWNETGVTFGKKDKMKPKRVEMKNQKMPKVTSSSSGLNLLKSNSGSGRAPLAAPISARSYISMDDMKREAARRNWRRLVKKINSNKQNGVKNCGGGERGQLRQAGRKKVLAAISVPHGEPGPLMLSASAISAFSVTGDSTILESKLKRRYALEWEYLASVLDRVLLIVFSLVVFTVTSIMILVGEAMHLSYELAAKEF
ncbi:hypothetical protein CRE_30609 [Caenorhabditis remanei]|uniref:Uncharacterized protein n=1 Tax=Caenorhabditis remanei TaxID=31234 RepID=E3NT04_CAERE|nr:hypothetical protein CRE_30609 [Caenorhabditis remanei]